MLVPAAERSWWSEFWLLTLSGALALLLGTAVIGVITVVVARTLGLLPKDPEHRLNVVVDGIQLAVLAVLLPIWLVWSVVLGLAAVRRGDVLGLVTAVWFLGSFVWVGVWMVRNAGPVPIRFRGPDPPTDENTLWRGWRRWRRRRRGRPTCGGDGPADDEESRLLKVAAGVPMTWATGYFSLRRGERGGP